MNRIDTAHRLENVDMSEANDMRTASDGSTEGCSTGMERKKKYIQTFDGKLEGNTRPRHGWMDSIKWILPI